MVRLIKDFFGVDRVGLFLIDKVKNTMLLKVSQSSAGIEVPLRGIAGFITKTGTIVNLPDVYSDSRFDPSMDLRTGYRTKQMLCIPVYDRPGSVAAVLQLINTFDGRAFNEGDENLAILVTEQIGVLLNKSINRVTRSSMVPIHTVLESFRFRLASVVFQRPHNHLKCFVKLFHGATAYSKVKHTSLMPTISLDEEKVKSGLFFRKDDVNAIRQCTFDTWIDFEDSGLKLSDLPVATRVVLSFYSKNNHPAGWTAFTLFDADRSLKSGRIKCVLQPGECTYARAPLPISEPASPTTTTSIAEKDVVYIELPTFEKRVYFETDSTRGLPESAKKDLVGVSSSDSDSSFLEILKCQMPPEERTRFEIGLFYRSIICACSI